MSRSRRAQLAVAFALVAACGDNDDPLSIKTTAIPAPTHVAASDGTSLDVVTVTWTSVVRGATYRLWRDGVELAYVTGSRYEDSTAESGTFEAPILSATSGTYPDRVLLTWSPPRGARGRTHIYSVIAVAPDGTESERSREDGGFRGQPEFLRWEVSTDGGQTYPSVATKTDYSDKTAPGGHIISPGVVSASDGTSNAHIAVSLSGTTVVDGPIVHYMVRAVTTGDPVPSNPADGYRGAGLIQYEWHRYLSSAGPTSGVILSSATSAQFNDPNVPPDTMFAYYCTLTALHAEPMVATTEPDDGWRAP